MSFTSYRLFLVASGLSLLLSVNPLQAQEGDTEEPVVTAENTETSQAPDTTPDAAGAEAAVAVEEVAEVVADAGTADVVAKAQPASRRVNRIGIKTTDEFNLDLSAPIVQAPTAVELNTPDVSLLNAEQDARLQDVLVRLALDPQDADALSERNAILDDVLRQARIALAVGQMVTARRLVGAVATLDAQYPGLEALSVEISARESRNQALASARVALDSGNFFGDNEDDAFFRYSQILAEEPESEEAVAGMVALLEAVIAAAKTRATAGEYEQALGLLDQAGQIPDSAAKLAAARTEVRALLQNVIAGIEAEAIEAIDSGEFDLVDQKITQLVALGAEADNIEVIRQSLADARMYGSLNPGQEIRDQYQRPIPGQAPIMVVVPAGEFLMGSDAEDEDSTNNERPVHRVEFKRGFALARTEITVAEFRQFVDDTRYVTDAERNRKSRVYDEKSGTIIEKEDVNWRHDYHGEPAEDNLPVLHVSWKDAVAYTEWLSEVTGRRYRLPSEAEFEYALRAGSQTRYWWGDGTPEAAVENVTGARDKSASRRRWTDGFRKYDDGFWGPAPVASLVSNPFGLFDMGGNVSEWVLDCWHSSYVQAPVDGSAWMNPGCTRRVIRGASWSSAPAQARSAARVSAKDNSNFSRVGFRVVREL